MTFHHAIGVLPALLAGFLAAAGTWAGPAATAPTPAPATKDSGAMEILQRLEKLHAPHTIVSGTFSQTKTDPVFLEDIRSSGSFYFERAGATRPDAPDRFWFQSNEVQGGNYRTSTHWVIGNEAINYFPSLRQVERYRLPQVESGIGQYNPMALAFGLEPEKILRYFTVEELPTTRTDVARLAFTPTGPPNERPFRRFILHLRRADLEPVLFEIEEVDDSTTRIRVAALQWNPRAQPERFQLNFPRGTTILEADE